MALWPFRLPVAGNLKQPSARAKTQPHPALCSFSLRKSSSFHLRPVRCPELSMICLLVNQTVSQSVTLAVEDRAAKEGTSKDLG